MKNSYLGNLELLE